MFGPASSGSREGQGNAPIKGQKTVDADARVCVDPVNKIETSADKECRSREHDIPCSLVLLLVENTSYSHQKSLGKRLSI